MKKYQTIPTDYPNELFRDGKRDKARAFFEYCFYINLEVQNSISFYAKSWNLSKSNTHIWTKDFAKAIEKYHNFWLENNTKTAERLQNDSRTAKQPIAPKNTGPKKVQQNDSRTIAELSINNNININIIKDFLNHRKQLKKPMSERALTLFVNKLVKLRKDGYEIEELVNDAIVAGWQSVYPKKENKQTKAGVYQW